MFVLGFLNISLRSLPKIPPEVYNQLIPRSSPYHPSNTATPQDAPMSLHDSVSFAMTPPEEVHPDGPKWWEVVDLTSIKASNNEFTQIDDCLGGFETLKVLDLRCNSIKAPLPASLCSLINLTSVNLARNKLAEWPIEIMALEHLKELDLSENDLSSLWPRDWTQKMSSRLKDSVRSRKYRMKTREDADVSCESSDSQNTTSDRDLSGEFCESCSVYFRGLSRLTICKGAHSRLRLSKVRDWPANLILPPLTRLFLFHTSIS